MGWNMGLLEFSMSLGFRNFMEKYWTGYNIYCSWVYPCIVWIKSVVEGLRRLNIFICEYLWRYIFDYINSSFANVLGGVKGMKYGVIACF